MFRTYFGFYSNSNVYFLVNNYKVCTGGGLAGICRVETLGICIVYEIMGFSSTSSLGREDIFMFSTTFGISGILSQHTVLE